MTSILRFSKFKRKHGTYGRQGNIGNQDTPTWEYQSSNLRVFFLLLMQYRRATQRGTLCITTHVSLRGFLYLHYSSSLHKTKTRPTSDVKLELIIIIIGAILKGLMMVKCKLYGVSKACKMVLKKNQLSQQFLSTKYI